MQRGIATLLAACLYAYSFGLIVYGVLRLTTGEAHNSLRLVDVLMPLLALPSLVLLPLTLLARRWRMALALLPAVIAFVLLYGAMFVPRAAATASPDLTLMTYNVLDGNMNTAAMSSVIRDADADIVVIEEASGYVDKSVTPSVYDLYPYASIHQFMLQQRLGLGVYSRYPLLADGYVPYYAPQSSLLRLQVSVKGTLVTIYAVHLANPLSSDEGYDPHAHSDDITALLDLLANEHGPLIVAGDFNMTDISADYDRMTAHLTDSFRESGYGLGFTYPSWSPVPLVRLDYIFHNDAFRSIGTQVIGSSGGSDHFPVRAELAFEPSQP